MSWYKAILQSYTKLQLSKQYHTHIKTGTKINETEQRALKLSHAYMINYFFKQRAKIYNMERIISLINGVEKTGCWERLRAGGEGDDRGWDGWMASLTQWTWVWVGPGNWWWTGRPGVLWFMGSQRVRHDWATELNWTEHNHCWWILESWSASRKEIRVLLGNLSQEALIGKYI